MLLFSISTWDIEPSSQHLIFRTKWLTHWYQNDTILFMPSKIKQLIKELERAGFVDRGGKGSHRNFVHPKMAKPVTISGKVGDDALHYQVRAVKKAIEESKK